MKQEDGVVGHDCLGKGWVVRSWKVFLTTFRKEGKVGPEEPFDPLHFPGRL
jgi:hypothetical protein